MGVDVVMVNFQTPHDAAAFIDSYRSFESEVDSTLTVFNVCPTIEDEFAVETALDKVQSPVAYMQHKDNVGYAFACNESFGATDGEHRTIAFFNADTKLRSGVLGVLDNALHANEDWGVVGPRQIDDYARITSAGVFGTEAAPELRGWQQHDQGQFNDIRDDAVSVSGSAYFVKRTAWEDLTECTVYSDFAESPGGAFLPTKHYYEETWCSYHARAHGWKVAYYGEVYMTHLWHQASPVGGIGEQAMPQSQQFFREMCQAHNIPHD